MITNVDLRHCKALPLLYTYTRCNYNLSAEVTKSRYRRYLATDNADLADDDIHMKYEYSFDEGIIQLP